MSIILLLILVLIINYIYKLCKNEKFTDFKLYNVKNKLISNKSWEYTEQSILKRYLNKNDNVLQLGGNIGTSCILVDKLLNKNQTNICVEPNNKIIETLKRNKQLNNSKFNIIYGAITEKKNLKLSNENEKIDLNYWGSKISQEGDVNVNSYSLLDIENINKINVLFADCEGCLELFINEYESFLKQLRLVIYEADQRDICNYKKIENVLKKNNFENVEIVGQNYIWKK